MICVTTHTIEKNEIMSYRGIVAAEVVDGVNWLADVASDIRDSWGGRGREYERQFNASRMTPHNQQSSAILPEKTALNRIPAWLVAIFPNL